MRKPKGYWLEYENCKKEILALTEKRNLDVLPSIKGLEKLGIPRKAVLLLGGREAVGEMLGIPLKRGTHENPRVMLEKWEGKPSKAFEIEAEARQQGLCYADIQKAKTLAMVGGVKI